jgi:hypothetical protein
MFVRTAAGCVNFEDCGCGWEDDMASLTVVYSQIVWMTGRKGIDKALSRSVLTPLNTR